MLYMVTFTINIPPMLVYIYIPYMDPMGYCILFDIMGFPQPLLHTMCLYFKININTVYIIIYIYIYMYVE